MDGFSPSEGIIVIGATNQRNLMDEALLRAGRFDRKVEVKLPGPQQRGKIMNIHLEKRKHNISKEAVNICSKMAESFSGAELETIVNEAASLAIKDARTNKQKKAIISDENL